MKSSKPSEDELASAYRAGIHRQPWPGPDCPSQAAIGRLALGEGGADERVSLAEHVAECAQCAALVRDMRSLEGWAQRVADPQSRARRPWRRPVALAASVALAVGVALLLRETAERSPEAIRGTAAQVTPAPGAELPHPPERFSWPDHPGATGYRVELQDGRGDLLWESPWVVESSCPLPQEIADALPSGAYLWTVEMRGTVYRSRLGPFVLELAMSHGGSGTGFD